MTDDPRKRASLQGKGWQIFKGKDSVPDEDAPAPQSSDQLEVTDAETADLLEAAPPPLGRAAIEHDAAPPKTPAGPSPVEAKLPDDKDFAAARDSQTHRAVTDDTTPVDAETMRRIHQTDQQSLVGEMDKQDLSPGARPRSRMTGHSKYDTLELTDEAVPLIEEGLPVAPNLAGATRPARQPVTDITPRQPETTSNADPSRAAQRTSRPTSAGLSGAAAQGAQLSRDELASLGGYSIDQVPDFAQHGVSDTPAQAMARGTLGQGAFTQVSEGERILPSKAVAPPSEDPTPTDLPPKTPASPSKTGSERSVPPPPEYFDTHMSLAPRQTGTGGIIPAAPSEWMAQALHAAAEQLGEDTSPLDEPARRLAAAALFGQPRSADPRLADKLIDIKRIAGLWNQIEELQEALIDHEHADRAMIDIYQQELHHASNLLLESRDNYDDARAIINRVRADMKRDERTREFIRRYRPRVLVYLAVWSVILLGLGIGHTYVEDFALQEGIPFLAEAFLPAVFGAGGGLLSAYLTLDKHTTDRHDFHPIHLPWYFASPAIGGLMGFMMFLLITASIATTVTQNITAENALRDWPVVIWLLAFVAGMQQNFVLNRIRGLRSTEEAGAASSSGKSSK